MDGPFDSTPGAPVTIAISDPPIAPVVLSFDSSPEQVPGAARPGGRSPGTTRRLAGWAVDVASLAGFVSACVLGAARLGGHDPLFVLVRGGPLWLGLAAGLSVAWSWIFVAGCGRTPGMALTGQRLQTLAGERPGPGLALARALLAPISAAAGLFGFVLALFDPRGQTLHDKICRCIAVVD